MLWVLSWYCHWLPVAEESQPKSSELEAGSETVVEILQLLGNWVH